MLCDERSKGRGRRGGGGGRHSHPEGQVGEAGVAAHDGAPLRGARVDGGLGAHVLGLLDGAGEEVLVLCVVIVVFVVSEGVGMDVTHSTHGRRTEPPLGATNAHAEWSREERRGGEHR